MRRPVGLRMRLVLALLATSLVTLGASVATLLPPLDHRLERDRLNELRVVARTARFAILGLPENVFERGTASARSVVLDLQRRTGGHVALFLPDGTPIVATAPEGRHPAPVDELQQVRDMHLPRVTDVREGVRDGEAVLLSGVQRPGGDRLILVMRKPLDDTRAAADTVRRALPLALAVGLAVALLVALALSRSLLVRLRRLREDARALGSEGLRHEIEVGPPDEVGEVAGALEAMRARLVGEEEARQAFLATASHELRTPLATLQATLELMDEDLRRPAPAADPVVLQARAASALRQTHRLTGLATDLLDLSRVDGEAPLSAEPLELVECVAMVREEATEALGAAGRRLEVTGAAPIHARADPAAVRRILHVLLDNARAYGAGTVRLDVRRDGDDALVVVTDEGPGLTGEDRDHVFERFRRGEAGHASPGFGLGLPIARGLAERMGGTLTAPEAPGGARFELRLPGWSPEG
jgi:signal transduction histidine kinase